MDFDDFFDDLPPFLIYLDFFISDFLSDFSDDDDIYDLGGFNFGN